jgi:hypothetical protein
MGRYSLWGFQVQQTSISFDAAISFSRLWSLRLNKERWNTITQFDQKMCTHHAQRLYVKFEFPCHWRRFEYPWNWTSEYRQPGDTQALNEMR